MPTTRERLTITRVERVDAIIAASQARLPQAKPVEALLTMAERGIESTRTRGVAGLMLAPDEAVIDLDAVEAALSDD